MPCSYGCLLVFFLLFSWFLYTSHHHPPTVYGVKVWFLHFCGNHPPPIHFLSLYHIPTYIVSFVICCCVNVAHVHVAVLLQIVYAIFLFLLVFICCMLLVLKLLLFFMLFNHCFGSPKFHTSKQQQQQKTFRLTN